MNKAIMRAVGFGIDTADFQDELSLREFHISGLCQTCQDKVFGKTKKPAKKPKPAPIVLGENDFLSEADGRMFWGGPKDGRKFAKYIGKSGKTWIVGIGDDCASEIYVSADEAKKNRPVYVRVRSCRPCGFQGFDGAELEFTLEAGDTIVLKGPWHSNSEDLYADTGFDVRNKHLTKGVIAENREYVPGSYRSYIFRNVLYRDEKPVSGEFCRVTKLATEMAKKLNKPLVCYSETSGGYSNVLIYPDQIDVHGKRESKTIPGQSAVNQ